MNELTVSVEYGGERFVFMGEPPCYILAKMSVTGRFYEEDLLDTILTRYGTGGVYIDFGAYIGTHSVFFSRICKADLVVAVEGGIPYRYLHQNLQANNCPNVEAWPVAVGDRTGRGRIVFAPEGNQGGGSIEYTDELADTVPVVPAASVITAKPKVIKIDVESMTDLVLHACRSVIASAKPIVVVEDAYNHLEPIMQAWDYKQTGRFAVTPTFIYEPTGAGDV